MRRRSEQTLAEDAAAASSPGDRRAARTVPAEWRLGTAFWRLLAASTSSNVADGLLRVALPLLAASLTRDPVLIAALTSLAFLPWLLFALPAGALVDRMDRRRAMAAGNAVRALALLILSATVLTGSASMPVLYAVAFAIGVAETVYDSAARAMVPQVLSREQLDRGNGLMTVGEEGGQSFVGAPVGAALFALMAAAPFLVTAGAYVVSAAIVLTLAGVYRPVSARPRATVRRDIADGISWLWSHRFLRRLTLVSATTAGLESMASALMVLWALDVLGVGQAGYGLLLTASGVGAVAGGLVAAPLAARIGRSATLVLGGVVASLAVVGAGLSRHGLLAGAFLALTAAGVMFWNVLTMSLRQALIPQHLFGRVQGGYRTLVWGAIPLGALLGGVLADLTSVPTVFVVVGLGQLMMAGVLARLLAQNRSLIAEAFAERPADQG
jgi:MFS family permease